MSGLVSSAVPWLRLHLHSRSRGGEKWWEVSTPIAGCVFLWSHEKNTHFGGIKQCKYVVNVERVPLQYC